MSTPSASVSDARADRLQAQGLNWARLIWLQTMQQRGAAVVLWLSSRRASPRIGRAERIGLDSYERKARLEGAFPFDYLTR